MRSLDGRVAVITGAGRGLGRAHALLFAREGACVVVNDTGGGNDGGAADQSVAAVGDAGDGLPPAESVVAEIRAGGGEAVANSDDVADWDGAQRLVGTAIDAFGGVDVLVNNAGILRDRLVVNMTENEWDDVIRVHLRGHFCPTHHAAAFWREEHKAGRGKPRHIVNTSSTSGLMANPGQSNYGAAKSGIATFTQIVAKELARYDVKANCIAPAARTRMTLSTPGLADIMSARDGMFDEWDPANVSPLVAYLSSEACRFSGETFFVRGGTVQRVRSWELAESVRNDAAWSVDDLTAALEKL
jgi:NAD(P)-dependent dehydrogenase (short-subunit alcohol dehydrogenase family)